MLIMEIFVAYTNWFRWWNHTYSYQHKYPGI